MDPKVKATLEECTHGSDSNDLTFPEVVQKLSHAGIERYHADLRRGEKTYYLPNGDSHVVASAEISGEPAHRFSAPGVEAAVRSIQTGSSTYKEFCERIVAAGCVGYFVTLAGRRAVYYGRTNDEYVEPFPALT